MNCDATKDVLERYLDDELSTGARSEVDAHLESCPDCVAQLERLRELSLAVRNPALRHKAPAYLEAKVRASLREAAAPKIRSSFAGLRWFALAAGLTIAAVTAWRLLPPARQSDQQTVAQEAMASHIRSLQANHLFDVPSTDQHTVKPWFEGKLDFSPDVKDIGQGFRLLGGRLDYFDGRPVAALVFQRRLHIVNLFVWPSSEPSRAVTRAPARNGYNIVDWTSGGMNHWAVADIPVEELEDFRRLYTR